MKKRRVAKNKRKKGIVLKKEEDFNQSISAYILLFLPIFESRICRVRLCCILLLIASEMLVNPPHVKQSTVWMFIDTANAYLKHWYTPYFFIFTSVLVIHLIYFPFVWYSVLLFRYITQSVTYFTFIILHWLHLVVFWYLCDICARVPDVRMWISVNSPLLHEYLLICRRLN